MTTYKHVVSNSSPLMNLVIIGQLDLLRMLFGSMSVPDEVWHGLTVAGHGQPGAESLLKTDWIEFVSLANRTLFRSLQKDLDDGEAAAISLAIESKADLCHSLETLNHIHLLVTEDHEEKEQEIVSNRVRRINSCWNYLKKYKAEKVRFWS